MNVAAGRYLVHDVVIVVFNEANLTQEPRFLDVQHMFGLLNHVLRLRCLA